MCNFEVLELIKLNKEKPLARDQLIPRITTSKKTFDAYPKDKSG
jgi:hypothetical protein